MAFLLAIVTYLDRVCISIAAPAIVDDLGITLLQMGTAFSAFTLAYSLFEIPSGWLGDRIGPRRVLTRIVLWWSAFTMLTGLVQGLRSLIVVRFLFGAGEAGAFPNVMRSFATWFPARERGMASGVVFFGTRLGGALAAPVMLVLIQRWGWRACFYVFGVLGVVWAWAWQRSYRDRPADHPDVNAAELSWIDGGRSPAAPPPTPWRQLISSGNLYAICAMYFGYAYGLYFYFTWLPTYLVRELGFSPLGSGFFASLPFILAGIANLAGGWCTDRLARTHGLRHARVTLGCVSFATSAALIVGSLTVPGSVPKALLLALALASADFALSACWAVCLDIGEAHAGVVTACMNSVGNLGGLAGPIVVGYMVDTWHSWTMPLYVTAGVYAFGALAWLAIDPRRRITPT
jgi:MFS transporter, ACS family, glucarate transporter